MRPVTVSALLILSILLSAGPQSGGVVEAYLKPYFNITVDAQNYQASMESASKAIQNYGYLGVKLQLTDPYTWKWKTPNGGQLIASVVEIVAESDGSDTTAAMDDSKDMANLLFHNYDKTLGSLKGHFSKQGLTLWNFTTVTRTTTFVFTMPTDSWNKAGGGQIALEKLEKAVSTAIGVTGCSALAEGSPLSGGGQTNVTFQFYGSTGESCETKCLSIVKAGYPKDKWDSAFSSNGLALSNVAFYAASERVIPPPATGFGAWVSNHPEAVAGIIAGLVIIIFIIVLVVVHRRAKQAEKLRDTMEAMLGPEEHGQVQGGGGAKRPPGKRSGKKMPPGGKGPAPAPAPQGGAAPAPQGGQQSVAAAPAPTQQQQQQQPAAPQVATSNGEGEGQLYGEQPEVQQA